MIPPGHFIFVHASKCVCVCVCVCSACMRRLDSMCVCFEGHCHVRGSGGGGGTPCSNQGALIPVYLPVIYQYMRSTGERRDRPRWQMHSIYRKTVMVCRVAGRKRSYGLIRLASRWANRQKSVHAAAGTCSLHSIDRRTRGQTGRVTDSMRATDGWTDASWCRRSRVRHRARYSV